MPACHVCITVHNYVERIKPLSLVTRSHCSINIAECRAKLHPSLCVASVTHIPRMGVARGSSHHSSHLGQLIMKIVTP